MPSSAGEYPQVVAIAFGVGALAARSLEAFTLMNMKMIGGLYLIYLGIRTFRKRKVIGPLLTTLSGNPQPDRRSLLQGMTVGATNPKTMVFMAAILPQFVMRTAGAIPA